MDRFFIILVLIAAVFCPARNLFVVKIHAGNVLECKTGERVKFLGIACPTPHQPFGKEALAFTRSLLTKRRISLQFDGASERRDESGVIYAYIYLICDTCETAKFSGAEDAPNVISFSAPLINMNKLMLEKGWARVDSVHACGKRGYFKYIENKARRNKAGMWKAAEPSP